MSCLVHCWNAMAGGKVAAGSVLLDGCTVGVAGAVGDGTTVPSGAVVVAAADGVDSATGEGLDTTTASGTRDTRSPAPTAVTSSTAAAAGALNR